MTSPVDVAVAGSLGDKLKAFSRPLTTFPKTVWQDTPGWSQLFGELSSLTVSKKLTESKRGAGGFGSTNLRKPRKWKKKINLMLAK